MENLVTRGVSHDLSPAIQGLRHAESPNSGLAACGPLPYDQRARTGGNSPCCAHNRNRLHYGNVRSWESTGAHTPGSVAHWTPAAPSSLSPQRRTFTRSDSRMRSSSAWFSGVTRPATPMRSRVEFALRVRDPGASPHPNRAAVLALLTAIAGPRPKPSALALAEFLGGTGPRPASEVLMLWARAQP